MHLRRAEVDHAVVMRTCQRQADRSGARVRPTHLTTFRASVANPVTGSRGGSPCTCAIRRATSCTRLRVGEPRVPCLAQCASLCCVFRLRVSVAVLLELTELAEPVERPCLCCNTQCTDGMHRSRRNHGVS